MSRQTNRFIQGTLILTAAGLAAKVISIFYKIPLTNLAGEAGFGYYETIYPIYALLTSMAIIGIPNTISKIIAEEWCNGHYKRAHFYFKKGFVLSVVFGALMTLLLLAGIQGMIRLFRWDNSYRYVIIGFSISPVFVGISGAIKGYFQGMHQMKPSAFSQMIENTGKVIIGVSLVVLMMRMGQPIHIAIAGAAVGASSGILLSALYMLWQYKRSKAEIYEMMAMDTTPVVQEKRRHVTQKLLKIAIPVTIVAASYSLMRFIDSATIYNGLGAAGWTQEEIRIIVGRFGKLQSIINVPMTMSLAISASMVPAISGAHAKMGKDGLAENINVGIRVSMIFALPAAAGIISLAQPLIIFLFPNSPKGAHFLEMYAVSLIFLIVGQTLASMLQGIGDHKVALVALGAAVALKFAMNVTMLPAGYGADAAVYSTIAYYLLFALLCFGYIKVKIPHKTHWVKILIKPVVSAALMGIIVKGVYVAVHNAVGSNAAATLAGVMVGMAVYFAGLLLLKAIDEEDLALLPEKLARK